MFSICILCGGKSKRFGTNKTFYALGDKTILETVYDKLKNHTDDIFLQLSATNDGQVKLLSFAKKMHFDLIPDKGPLGGIYSALKNAKYDRVFIIAGDLPFIDKDILAELSKYTEYQLVIPKWENGYVEPLCTIYSKELLPIIENQIKINDLKINNLFKVIDDEDFEKVMTKYVNINYLIKNQKISVNCFRNINSFKDLENWEFNKN